MSADDGPVRASDYVHEDSLIDVEDYLDLIDAVTDPERFELVEAVLHGDGPTAAELSNRLDRSKDEVLYDLNQLVNAGIVENRVIADGDDRQSYYALTSLGERVHGWIADTIEADQKYYRDGEEDEG